MRYGPGASENSTWAVKVSESFIEENFAVSGSIDVSNPAVSPRDMTVYLVVDGERQEPGQGIGPNGC
jgi:hypothetical protein